MERVKVQCAIARNFVVLVVIMFFAAGLAIGQGAFSIRLDVPTQFTVGSTVLPAGLYTFSARNETFSRLTVQSGNSAGVRVNILAWSNGPDELFRGGDLVFDKSKKGLILSEVWMSGQGGVIVRSIPKGDQRTVLSGDLMESNHSYTGKQAFDLTCAKCHGEDGRGNPAANKFFGLSIPQLTSSKVQSLSDEALRKQITLGSNAMPPVEVDEAGFRHRLPSQDVDAVIAYVRALKQ